MKVDKNGYAPSIMQHNTKMCYCCGRRDRKLDRHEPFGGAYRDKSKAMGLWIMLCHDECHEGRYGAHGDPEVNRKYRQEAQRAAMSEYGMSTEQFIRMFGKNYIEEES